MAMGQKTIYTDSVKAKNVSLNVKHFYEMRSYQ